jgi:UDP-N-acetylglucosamine/UDP-N-acetylgalactosamine diphosphorylase
MSSKMVPKVSAEEKVGVFCEVDGRTVVIEYSDLPESLAAETDADGGLRFIAGSIAIHLLGIDFIRRVSADDGDRTMPFHRARKKVPFWNAGTGDRVEPDAPNATKFEMFVFDALAFVDRGLVLATDRAEEFAPIKNAEGGDSAESSGILQTERAARWLEAAGVKVPRRENGDVDGRIEITPATALEPGDLIGITLPTLTAGADVVI